MRKKRTDIDFSQHYVVTSKTEDVTMHHIKLPDTRMHSVRFINAYGIMAVTGDFGNWIFCREFHPGPKEYISDGYWLEKLSIASCQKPMEPDWESTTKELKELIESGYEACGYEGDNLKEMKEYAQDCLNAIEDGERRYDVVSVDQLPSCADYEDIVNHTKPQFWLLAVFDAFEEICDKLKTT